MRVPEGLQLLGHALLQPEILIEPDARSDPGWHRTVTLQPSGNAVVGKLGMITNRCSIKVRTLQCSIPGDHHFNYDGKAVRFKVERCKIGREFFGQHWKCLGAGIYRGGVVPRMVVKC